jgi:hypothetical protein
LTLKILLTLLSVGFHRASLNSCMRLHEIFDPIKIPTSPLAKARQSSDFAGISMWLCECLIKELNKEYPGWQKSNKSVDTIIHSLHWWKQIYPQKFPRLQTNVWHQLEDNDLSVGVESFEHSQDMHAFYWPSRKLIMVDATQLKNTADVVKALAHELRHAYDDTIAQGKGLGATPDLDDYSKYLANPAEIRARFQELQIDLVQELYFPDGSKKDISYFKLVVPELMAKYELSAKHLKAHPQPQILYQQLIKKAYLLKQSFDKLSNKDRSQIIKSIKGMPTNLKPSWWQRIKHKLNID